MGTAAVITAIAGLVTALGGTGWFVRKRRRARCAKASPPPPPT